MFGNLAKVVLGPVYMRGASLVRQFGLLYQAVSAKAFFLLKIVVVFLCTLGLFNILAILDSITCVDFEVVNKMERKCKINGETLT